jgi:hypothetical protein
MLLSMLAPSTNNLASLEARLEAETAHTMRNTDLADFASAVYRASPSLHNTGATPASFSLGFTDEMILQRDKPARLYGFAGDPFTLPATVELKVVDESGATATETVHAAVANETGSGGLWSVDLATARPAGGNFTVSAACVSGCDNSAPTTISNVTFGDLYYCAGQAIILAA